MINWKNKKVNDESVRDETVIEEPVKEEINNSEMCSTMIHWLLFLKKIGVIIELMFW